VDHEYEHDSYDDDNNSYIDKLLDYDSNLDYDYSDFSYNRLLYNNHLYQYYLNQSEHNCHYSLDSLDNDYDCDNADNDPSSNHDQHDDHKDKHSEQQHDSGFNHSSDDHNHVELYVDLPDNNLGNIKFGRVNYEYHGDCACLCQHNDRDLKRICYRFRLCGYGFCELHSVLD